MYQNTIPVLDLKPEIDALWDKITMAVEGVLRSGEFIMGSNVKAFESEVAEYLGVGHAIGVNSGTDALVIALRAAGVKEGDEVITTPFTFFATAEAISVVGAKPVFVDVDQRTFNLNADLIENAITEHTRAILPVHLYGLPADMRRIMEVGHKHGLVVIEDCAQAFGATYEGERVGTIGQVGCFSFFPSKNLGAFGDAGLLCTNDERIAETAKTLRAHGSKVKYFNETIGYNSRLDEIQAAILRVKLPFLDEFNMGRRRVAMRYNEILGFEESLAVPWDCENSTHVYHQYTVRVTSGSRDVVQRRLRESGVGTAVYYPCPVHKLPMYAHYQYVNPVSERLALEVLSLPIWPTMAEETQARICKEMVRAIRGVSRENIFSTLD